MINVYTPDVTPRIDYAFKLIFETILQSKVLLFDNKNEFSNSKGPKINYSLEQLPECLNIKPFGLLNEAHLQYQIPDMMEWDGYNAFFAVDHSFLPFDLFAASFYLVSRYEEYLPGKRDSHQRFMARYSLAGRNLFLEKPLVNIWAMKLANIIENSYPDFQFNRPKFRYIPTFDIDNAWAFKNKGILRSLISPLNDIAHRRWKSFKRRIQVLWRLAHDPYDNYDFMLSTLKQYHFRPVTFFLMRKKGKRDRAVSHLNLFFRSLVLRMAKAGKVGIHPSYSSNKRTNLLHNEISRLSKITGKSVKRSRQHYLKFNLPKTFRNLMEQGIEIDYSMGYASRPGFRASIATPFYFFDLVENKTTKLKIFPFQVMDVTLLNYRHMRASDAIKKINYLMDETAKVGGTFISLWHNETLSDEGRWEGWREVYQQMTQKAAELRNGNETTTFTE